MNLTSNMNVTTSVRILGQLRCLFPSSTLLLLYYLFIHPHLLLGPSLRESTNTTYLIKPERLQKKAVHMIPNSELRAQINSHYLKLEILKLPELYELEIAKLMLQQYRQNLLH